MIDIEQEKIRLKNRKPWYIQLYEIFFLEILPKGTVNGYRELITCQKEKIQDLVLDNTRLRTYIEQQQYSKQYLEEQKVWKEFEELSNEQKKY